MTLLRGHFAMTLVCAGDAAARPTIEEALAPLGRRRHPDGDGPRGARGGSRTPAVGSQWVLTVHGGDRPGIVSAVIGEVARGRRQRHRPDHPPGRRPLPAHRRARPAGLGGRRLPRGVAAVGRRPAGRRRHPAARGVRRAVSVHPRVAAWTEADLDVVGRVRDVVRAPARVLSTDGDRVDPTAPETVQLAADLVATMRVSPGCVGLAAPQVGEGVKVFCVDVSAHPKTRDHHGTFVLCNAEVVESSRNEKAREGCMSVPDLTGDVKRRQPGRRPRPAARHRRGGHPRGQRLRGARPPARDRPLRRPALPRPRRRGRTRSTRARPTFSAATPHRPGIPIGRGSGLKNRAVWVRVPAGAPVRHRSDDPTRGEPCDTEQR